MRDAVKFAQKKWRLAERLNDPRKLIAALRYYDVHLVPGKWVELPAPRRERSRKLSRAWLDALTAARRILGVVTRRMKATRPPEELILPISKREAKPNFKGKVPLLDRGGRPRLAFYLRRDVWETIQSHLGFIQYAPGARNAEEPFKPIEEVNKERDRRRQEEALEDILHDPATGRQFKSLPAGFKMAKELEEFAAELGPLLVERTKAFLTKGIDPATRKMLEAKAKRDQLGKNQPRTVPSGKPPEQITVRDFLRVAKARIRAGTLNR